MNKQLDRAYKLYEDFKGALEELVELVQIEKDKDHASSTVKLLVVQAELVLGVLETMI